MTIPRTASKRRQIELDGMHHIIKPDIDNMIKYYLDICTNVVFKDDCIIAQVTARKVYDQNPRTQFTLLELK
jgi:Holliday junction resolvase RusA-like endonuclease